MYELYAIEIPALQPYSEEQLIEVQERIAEVLNINTEDVELLYNNLGDDIEQD